MDTALFAIRYIKTFSPDFTTSSVAYSGIGHNCMTRCAYDPGYFKALLNNFLLFNAGCGKTRGNSEKDFRS